MIMKTRSPQISLSQRADSFDSNSRKKQNFQTPSISKI